VLVLALVPVACGRDRAEAPADAAPASSDPVLVGAGDIASCVWFADRLTGRMLDSIPGTVFTVGDNVYQTGTAAQYRDCYEPVWGRVRDRTRPAVGNHDLKTDGGGPYAAYFGDRAGAKGKFYYSYDLGTWHIIVFNSNSEKYFDAQSEQMAWLREDLAAHPVACVLAYGHHPRFGSGERGLERRMKPLWDLLYAAGADVVLAGHEHFYERFAPQTPDGKLDTVRGIREFIVGTGGAPFYSIKQRMPNSEVISRTHGLLKLTLHEGSYDWEFIPVPGRKFTDRGTGRCSPMVNPLTQPATQPIE
jgi:acid phosphatase type 7